ncbi:MAG TPA: cytochrome c biogenesis protein [Candidatus Desulfovibrio intestinipullorum]|uniref:Cytochrome c biogenesis protein n=1 Tax=Candidatus Desulfovibrio intestinipullorum TaxID=2838536 RepID=A0A9D1TQS3_9BACT|nr:cytochrome c biogenesis protein [Candidatus Desulfovibrio intestinipullorum]
MTSLLSPASSTLLTLVLYAFAGVAGMLGMILKNQTIRVVAATVATCGFILQTVILFMGFHAQTAGGLSLGAYLQMMAWFVMLCGLVLWIKIHQEIPLLFGALLSLVLFCFSARSLQLVVHVPGSLHAPFYALHIGALYISLALIAISCVAGLLFLYLDKRLKARKPLPHFLRDLPALNILDSINSSATLAGFPLFTTGIVCGLIYAKPVYGATLTGDPKELISLVIWACFAVIFYGRVCRGWRGRKPARLMALVFVLCLFSIVGVNLFMNSHHAFTRI